MPVITVKKTPEKIHLLLVISGNRDKQEFFHSVLKDLDFDWPFGEGTANLRVCKVCHGVVWTRPRLQPQDLKMLGRQINESTGLPGHLKLKVMQFRDGGTCGEVWKKRKETGTK